MIRLCLLTLLALATTSHAQTVDSSLVALVEHLRESELRAGGWRDTLAWQPQDSTSADLLRLMTVRAHDTVLPLSDVRLRCPGGTDRSGAQVPQPVGYTLHLEIRSRASDSATVRIWVACEFMHRGRGHGFAQDKTWEAVKRRDGWHARLVRMGVT